MTMTIIITQTIRLSFVFRLFWIASLALAMTSHAEMSQTSTDQFIVSLTDFLERKVIGDAELRSLMDSAAGGQVTNPISQEQADICLDKHFARMNLQEYVETCDELDAAAVAKWASEKLTEQKHKRKTREETQDETVLPWEARKQKLLSVGDYHACAVKEGGITQCWGRISGHVREIGLQNFVWKGVRSISSWWDHVCVVKANDEVDCHGHDSLGETKVPSDLGRVQSVSIGDFHTCAVKIGGMVRCWGAFVDKYNQPPSQLGSVQSISAQHRSKAAAQMGSRLIGPKTSGSQK